MSDFIRKPGIFCEMHTFFNAVFQISDSKARLKKNEALMIQCRILPDALNPDVSRGQLPALSWTVFPHHGRSEERVGARRWVHGSTHHLNRVDTCRKGHFPNCQA